MNAAAVPLCTDPGRAGSPSGPAAGSSALHGVLRGVVGRLASAEQGVAMIIATMVMTAMLGMGR